VVEASFLNVPSLSNRYPAIEEMNDNYNLNITFFDVFDVHNTAQNLKWMDRNHQLLRDKLSPVDELKKHIYGSSVNVYWEEIRGLL
jgi:hypothetical protein